MTTLSLPSIGASVTTLTGLLGLAVACLTFIYSKRIAAKLKELEALPLDRRPQAVDALASLYGLTLKSSRDEEKKFELVTTRMRLRANSNRFFALLGAVVFLSCFAMLVYQPRSVAAAAVPSTRTAADEDVVKYKKDILDLRLEAETRDPGWESKVRGEGTHLAHLMGRIDEQQLHAAKVIIKHEYRGWALLIVADALGEAPQKNEVQAGYAEQAVHEFDLTLVKMEQISRDSKAGDPEAKAVYVWMTGESEDLNRSHYLRAAALAVAARAGGNCTKDDALKELAKIEPAYLTIHPPENHPALAWALKK